MLTVSEILSQTTEPVDSITLDADGRHRRRVRMTTDGGIEFLLDLPKARLLRGGEGLKLSDGRQVRIIAPPEPLYAVKASSERELAALCWQLGNRHLPTQILNDRLLIRRDPVIRDMLVGLGAIVEEVMEPFNPETGAYGADSSDHGHHHHD